VTETVPVPEGDTALHEEVVEQDTDVAAVDPNETVVPLVVVEKLVPVRVTVVAPEAGPEVGEIEVRVGAGI
jgi:hypothetical protein